MVKGDLELFGALIFRALSRAYLNYSISSPIARWSLGGESKESEAWCQ
jgi:hypothetical protein